jgi:beta-galactosidase
VTPLDAFGPRSWARPEVTGFGRLPTATFLHRDEEPLLLDGAWRFRRRGRPEDVTVDDLTGPTDGWDEVVVPGVWTMQGFDAPHYTNTRMPFAGVPPSVPDDNPTGVHRRTVEVPAAWPGRRIVLHVGGAESVLYVHVDGRPLAMGKDSRLPHEVDLTGVVEPGTSFDLALTVVRWSDGTWLEDQDHWYHAGLHRSVLLYATPPVHLADVHAVADWDPATGDGLLRVRATTGAGGHGPRGWSVRVEVAGQVLDAPVFFEHPTNHLVNLAAFEGRGATVEATVPGVEPWSAEAPVLHDLGVALLDDAGTVVDAATLPVGFRRVEVVGSELRVNGRRVLVKGVNRHDHDPRTGKAVSRESMAHDVVLMKRHNLNALRTSHYPNDPYLLDLCDRLGLYVVDEANVETHALLRSLTKDQRWAAAILDRVQRMALRDKNHPSVIQWSLGNESGVSPAHHAAAAWLRAFDPTRPVHYESGITEDGFAGTGRETLAEILHHPRFESDVIAPMYPPVEALVGWATTPGRPPDRPLVMCEYSHAMGNSCGGLDDYWDAIRAHDGLQGGFVWDWVDQALVQVLPDGRERLAYGGDFGDEPNDGPFCCNGVLAADRTPHPSAHELAKVVQPVLVEAADEAPERLRVTNEHAFLDLAWLQPAWAVTVDGEQVATGDLEPLDLPPGASADVAVPVPPLSLDGGRVAHLTLSFTTREERPWAPAGHRVAWEQVELGCAGGPAVAPGTGGRIRSLDVLDPTLAVWRAPIDNETFSQPSHAGRWESLGLRSGAGLSLGTTTATVDGGLLVEHVVTVPEALDDLPRVGARLHVGAGVAEVEWLGRGPHECYGDRRRSAAVGRWRLPVDEWTVRYVHPQGTGNRCDVRWLRLLDADGDAVLVLDGLDDLDVTVARSTDDEVAGADHWDDLSPGDDCWVWIDAAHRGVGSGAVGPDVHRRWRVCAGVYRWCYRIVTI